MRHVVAPRHCGGQNARGRRRSIGHEDGETPRSAQSTEQVQLCPAPMWRGSRCCRDRRGLAASAGAAPQKRCMTHPLGRRAARPGKRLEGRTFRGNSPHVKIGGKRKTSLAAPAPQVAATAGMCTPWHATENEWPGRQNPLRCLCLRLSAGATSAWRRLAIRSRSMAGGAWGCVFARTHRV